MWIIDRLDNFQIAALVFMVGIIYAVYHEGKERGGWL